MDAIAVLKNRRVFALLTILTTLLLASVVVVLMAGYAGAATFTVNSTADRVDANVGNGVCKTSAGTCTLRAAIQETNALSGPDTIRVPAGTYALVIRPQGGNGANTGDHDITGSLTIRGGGANSTILDAGQPPSGSPPEIRGLDRLLEIRATAGDVSVSGLTIREGYSAEMGGGIQYASAGTLRLENVGVVDSYAGKYGGAINNAGRGHVELVGSRLSGNGAVEGGSAINNAAAGTVAVLSGSEISGNPGPVVPDPAKPGGLILADPGDYPLGGGAIHNQAENDAIGTVRIADSTVSENAARRSGAAINNVRDGNVAVERSTISGNTTEGDGGAIHNASGVLTFMDSTISKNTARNGGGIYNAGQLSKASQPARVALTRSTVSGNTALQSGGGIFNGLEGELDLTGSTVSGNTATSDGGGVHSVAKTRVTATGGTISDNVADGRGGGVYTRSERPVTIEGVVFSGNAASDGGGLNTDGTGTVTVADSTFSANTAVGDGGGVAIYSKAPVTIERSTVSDNTAQGRGGGLQNSGLQVTLTGLTIDGNTATGNGGGIDNTSSGEFAVLESSIAGNTGENGGGFANAPDATVLMSGSTLRDNRALQSGGGFYSISDGESLIENTTVSSNTAQRSGGGVYHDADGLLRVVNVTIWRNSAPLGGGISTVESDFVPTVPPTPNASMVLRNTIVAGSLLGGSCDAMLTSEGGNIDGGIGCFFQGPRDRSNTDPGLEAIADNGGSTLTHALTAGSLAVDGGVEPCPATDQRGVTRPQNSACDVGAYEFEGLPLPPDETPPDTTITDASRANDGTPVFSFTGSDDATAESELLFECRILKVEPGQPTSDPEPPFIPCSSPHAVLEVEHGENTFEVRAVDRAGNVDPTPASHAFADRSDTTDPETTIIAQPPDPSSADSVIFSFAGSDDLTPPLLVRFECRLDSQNEADFTECRNPHSYADKDLSPGPHTFEVRAIDLAGNVDSSPASYSWTVVAPPETTIDSGPDDTASTTGEFTFSADQIGSTFECSLDGAPFEACDSPRKYTDLAVGDHRFDVRATNRFGLADQTPASYTWTVSPPPADNTPPQTTIDSAPNVTTTSTEARFTFFADESNPTFECSLDGAAFEVCTSPKEYTNLALGGHEFRVRATDQSGNTDQTPASRTWTVEAPPDATPPDTTITDQPTDPSSDGSATFRFTGSDNETSGPDLRFQCRLDSQNEADFVECASPQSYADLSEGSHTFKVRAIDREENIDATPASYSWSIEAPPPDTTPPETKIDSAPNVTTTSTEARFTFSTDEPGSTFECSLDGAEFVSCESPKEYRDLAVGEHELRVRATDQSGNTDQTPASHTWTIEVPPDTTPPETAIESKPDATTTSTNARFTFSAGEEGSTFECSLDGVEFASCTSPKEYTDLTLGEHEFRVRATDPAGNTDSTPASYTWTVQAPPDTTAPETTITERSPDPSQSSSASFSFTGSDNKTPASELAFQCRLDSQAEADWVPCSSPKSYSNLNEGSHTFEVRAIDRTGNVDPTPASYTWTVDLPPADTTPPDTTIDSGPDATTMSTEARFTFSADEQNSTFECALDGAAFETCASPREYAGLEVGDHEFRVRATDQSGNTDPEAASYHWTIEAAPDTTPPDTAIIDKPVDPSTSGSASFAFAGTDNATSDPDLRFQCRLDGQNEADFAECSSPKSYSNLAIGSYTFEVRAVDRAGNVDPTPASYSWRVEAPPPDTTAPQTAIDSGPDPTTTSTDARLTFSADEPGSTFECSLDGAEFAPCDSPKEYTNLALGDHEFRVRTTDSAGNTDSTPASHAWRIESPPDTAPPETTFDSGPDATTTNVNATFTFSANEPNSTFECSLDGAPFEACTSPKEYTALAVGEHELRVQATDQSGNTDETPASYTWTVQAPPDTSAPDTTITEAPADPSQSNSASFGFTGSDNKTPASELAFQCRLDSQAEADWVPCSSPKSYSNLNEGSHTFEARAIDLAGNVDPTPASYSWAFVPPPPLDTTAPETTIDTGPDATTTSTSARFTFFADESNPTFECSLDGAAFEACTSPREYINLALGEHEFRVRATDQSGNTDQTPASHAWTVEQAPPDCQEATIVAPVEADSWIGELITSNKGSDAILNVEANVASGNSRALVRFGLTAGVPEGCVVESARLRLFTSSASEGSRLEALRLASGWSENQVTWSDQPQTVGTAATAWSRDGYMQWNVTSQVKDMYATGVNNGFLIRDTAEGADGAGHGFHSREKGDSPPEIVIRFGAPPSNDPPGPPAPPTPGAVSCGQVLTQSTMVTNDLSECPGDGLVIGAPRIIIDLDGHTIDGVGLGTGVRNDGHDSVTVINGTVQDFDYGIELLSETERNVLEGLALQRNQLAGIELFDAGEGNEIRANTVADNGAGIALVSGTRGTVVVDNTMTLNGGPGLLVRDSNANRLERNTVSGGGDLGVDLERASGNMLLGNTISGTSDGGIELLSGSNGNRMEGNTVNESGDMGILVAESDHNALISNTTHGMSDSGVTLNGANDGVVRGNDLQFNPGGLQMDGASRNLIEANNASNTTGIGIELGGGSFDNDLVQNTANANAAQGIYVADEALADPGNLLDRNTASGNMSSGIVTAKGGHILIANTTRDNKGWGISAALGTIDGGGNVASGNAEPGQCLGIVCSLVTDPPLPDPSDPEAPDTTITGGPAAGDGTASFTFTGSDNRTAPADLTFECRLDAQDWVPCSSPQGYANLGSEPHTFEVRAIDGVGNVDPTPASHTWTEEPPTCAPQTITSGANADSWVLQDSATSNYGDDAVLKVDSKSGANARAMVGFGLPAIPAGCQVVDAQLRMYASSFTEGRTLQALALAAPWSEERVTWSNQPAAAGAAAEAASTLGYVEWSVTQQVKDMYSGANHGFLIRDSAEDETGILQGFHSREKAPHQPPELVITFE